jgi:hypothetical protein
MEKENKNKKFKTASLREQFWELMESKEIVMAWLRRNIDLKKQSGGATTSRGRKLSLSLSRRSRQGSPWRTRQRPRLELRTPEPW